MNLPKTQLLELQLAKIDSTMKMVRGKITDRYTDFIKFLYTPEAKNICHGRNIYEMLRLGFTKQGEA